MNQNFSKSRIYTNHLNWSIFDGGKNLGVQIFGGKNIGPLEKCRFPTTIIFVIFWTGGENSLDYLEKKCGNIG